MPLGPKGARWTDYKQPLDFYTPRTASKLLTLGVTLALNEHFSVLFTDEAMVKASFDSNTSLTLVHMRPMVPIMRPGLSVGVIVLKYAQLRNPSPRFMLNYESCSKKVQENPYRYGHLATRHR